MMKAELVFASFAIFLLKSLYLSLETERKSSLYSTNGPQNTSHKKCIQLHYHKESRDIKKELLSP